jgi:XkdW protein
MELWEQIIEVYPEIKATDNFIDLGIYLRDDSDGVGAYIAKWEYSKPIPEGLSLGKP